MTDDRQKLRDFELEAGVYAMDGWAYVRRFLEERLRDVTHRLVTDQIKTTTFEEVAEQKGQARELRRMLDRPDEVDKEIDRLRANLRAARESE